MVKPQFHTTKRIPNPDVVHFYMAETGSASMVDFIQVDVMKGANRQPEFLKVNPLGESPALVLPNGHCITEAVSICEYLDGMRGGTSIIGTTPEEKAETTMWTARVMDKFVTPMATAFQCGPMLKFFTPRRPGYIHAELREPSLKQAQAGAQFLESQLSDGRKFLCGDRFSIADIRLYCLYSFFIGIDKVQAVDSSHKNFLAYIDRVKARPAVAGMAKL